MTRLLGAPDAACNNELVVSMFRNDVLSQHPTSYFSVGRTNFVRTDGLNEKTDYGPEVDSLVDFLCQIIL